MAVPVDKKTASPLGKGKYHPAESLQDSELHSQLMRYRRGVASAYSSVSPDDIGKNFSSGGSFHISPKVDGELWFLVLDGKEPFLASPRGAVIQGDIPLLEEAKTERLSQVNCLQRQSQEMIDLASPMLLLLLAAAQKLR